MITTTYKCDRCGHEQPTNEQMWNVWVSYACLPYFRGYGSNHNAVRDALWCRPCMEAMQVLGAAKDDQKTPPPPPPTLEETILEIIREEVNAATGANR